MLLCVSIMHTILELATTAQLVEAKQCLAARGHCMVHHGGTP